MALSAISALVAKWPSLTGAPTLATFDEPVSVEANIQKRPPYTVLVDQGMVPRFEFERTAFEVTNVLLTTVCDMLADVEAALEIIKYNGGGVSDGLGLDFGTLPALELPYRELVILRTNQRVGAFKPTGKNSQRLHFGELSYQISLYRY
jgi:hypothetical protein